MAISFVGSGTKVATVSSATTFTFSTELFDASNTAGPTLQQDDWVYVVTAKGHQSTTVSPATLTTSGYSLVGSSQYGNDTEDISLAVYRKLMGATPDTSVVMASAANQQVMIVYVFRGVDTTTPDDATPVGATGTNGGQADPGSITPVTAGAWIFAVGGGALNAALNTYSNITGFSSTTNHFQRVQNSASVFVELGATIKTDWTSGALDPGAFGGTPNTNSLSGWAALTMALKPAASGTTFNDTISESATGGASLSAAATFAPTLSESATSGTSLGGAATFAPALSESAVSGDALGIATTFVPTLSEAATSAASLAAAATFTSALSESSTSGASLGAAATFAPALSEGATAGDGLGAAATLVPALAETATGTDSVVASVICSESVSESLSAAFTVAAGLLYDLTLDETATPGDTITASADFIDAISETLTGTDDYSSSGGSVPKPRLTVTPPRPPLSGRPISPLSERPMRIVFRRPSNISRGTR